MTCDQMSDNDLLSCTNSLVTIMVVINHRNKPWGPRCLHISKPSKSLVIISLALNTFLRVFCARLALSEWESKALSLCAVVLCWIKKISWCAGPLELGGSPARHRPSDLVWSGDDILVRGTWRPPSFVEKLLSGTRDQGNRGWVCRKTWFPRSDTLSECFNNVDVSVPLWLTEPRDKYPRQEFASSYPALYVSAFHTSNSCVPLLLQSNLLIEKAIGC